MTLKLLLFARKTTVKGFILVHDLDLKVYIHMFHKLILWNERFFINEPQGFCYSRSKNLVVTFSWKLEFACIFAFKRPVKVFEFFPQKRCFCTIHQVSFLQYSNPSLLTSLTYDESTFDELFFEAIFLTFGEFFTFDEPWKCVFTILYSSNYNQIKIKQSFSRL